uniref:hypothetical protein n=1 Tax=Falsiroseomonas oryziterrae TaxID=2911368 RepID=UPI001F4327F6
MTVNVLVRGQSNALLFSDRGGLWGMVAELEQQLGTDINPIFGWGDYNTPTINSGTAFTAWDTGGQQATMIDALRALPDEVKANPTITLWMHNEYDQSSGVSTEEWMREVRADAELVRDALGQDAATTPYVFVPVKYPYGDLTAVHEGMKALVADGSFNASLTDAALSLQMAGGPEAGTGSSHMSDAEAKALGSMLDAVLAPIVQALEAGAPVPAPSAPAPA